MTGAEGMNRKKTEADSPDRKKSNEIPEADISDRKKFNEILETDMPGSQDREITPQELVQYVRDICDAEALELIPGENGEVYIPYMMNDAVEAYCILEQASVPAEMPEDLEEVIDAVALCSEGRQGLCLRTEEEILGTIWYDSVRYRQTLYQYHRIMHCWEPGFEHMRMLVYMVGTISDKRTFLGEEAVNAAEKELIPLIEYKPFRDFSPIGESLDGWYPDTEEGRMAMLAIAQEAGEAELVRMIEAQGGTGSADSRDSAERHSIPSLQELEDGKRIRDAIGRSTAVFRHIYEKICRASSEYAPRKYDEALERNITAKKKEAEDQLFREGFRGSWPEYRRGEERLTVFEEHPFVLRGDELEFGLHFLLQDETLRIL